MGTETASKSTNWYVYPQSQIKYCENMGDNYATNRAEIDLLIASHDEEDLTNRIPTASGVS